MSGWRHELLGNDGTRLGEILPRNRSLVLDLAGSGSARYSMASGEAAALREVMQPGRCDLLVAHDSTPRMRGPLTGVQGSGLVVDRGSLDFAATGIAELLADRYIAAGTEIAATEQTQMAWQLIAATQVAPNGDLGILQGQLPDSVARTKQWDSPTPVLQAIRELAGLEGGFDWDIAPDATGSYRFDTWYPRRGAFSDVVLDERNIAQVSPVWDAGAGALCNAATVTGAAGVGVEAGDGASQLAYRRRERVIALSDADDAVLLGDRAAAEVRDSVVRPTATLRLQPGADQANLDEIELGDVLTVEFDAGWAALAGPYRVLRIEVQIPDGGADATLTVTTEPWDG